MRNRSGFTLVEIAVTLVVVGILLTLAVINFRSSQVNARDSERHADVENISVALESYHAAHSSGASPGKYPDTTHFNSNEFQDYLQDRVGHGSLHAPEVSTEDPSSLAAATNAATSPASVRPIPTFNTYVYQPLTVDGTLCSSSAHKCVSYNLYYQLEKSSDQCPSEYCTLRSKHS